MGRCHHDSGIPIHPGTSNSEMGSRWSLHRAKWRIEVDGRVRWPEDQDADDLRPSQEGLPQLDLPYRRGHERERRELGCESPNHEVGQSQGRGRWILNDDGGLLGSGVRNLDYRLHRWKWQSGQRVQREEHAENEISRPARELG